MVNKTSKCGADSEIIREIVWSIAVLRSVEPTFISSSEQRAKKREKNYIFLISASSGWILSSSSSSWTQTENIIRVREETPKITRAREVSKDDVKKSEKKGKNRWKIWLEKSAAYFASTVYG